VQINGTITVLFAQYSLSSANGFGYKQKGALLSRNTNKMQLSNKIYYYKVFLNAQHVSSGTPLIIRSSKLYLQPLVYMPIW
jgi:hypothetical protein